MTLIDIAYASEKIVEQSAETSEGVLASLGINSTLFIFQLINFIVVALILWFLVLKPLVKKMAERQDKITASLIKAEEVDANLRKSEAKYQEKIDQAKAAAAEIMTKARDEANVSAENIKEKSKQEIELLVAQAKKNIQIEKQEMLIEVKKQAGVLVTVALEKILEEKIDEKKDKELILRGVKNIRI